MIRPANPADAQNITDLWNVVITETLATFTTVKKTVDDIERLLMERQGACFVAEIDGDFSGFMTFGPFRSGPGYRATVEHTILVVEKFTGQGTADALLETGEGAARAMGHHVMVAGISGANARAEKFHTRHGYVTVGRMPQVGQKDRQWLDLVLMQKIL